MVKVSSMQVRQLNIPELKRMLSWSLAIVEFPHVQFEVFQLTLHPPETGTNNSHLFPKHRLIRPVFSPRFVKGTSITPGTLP